MPNSSEQEAQLPLRDQGVSFVLSSYHNAYCFWEFCVLEFSYALRGGIVFIICL